MVVSNDNEQKADLVRQATEQLLNQATLNPLFYESVPIILNNNYYFEDLEEFGEDIPLWKLRKNNNVKVD